MMLYPELSKKIIDAFYEVCRNLAVGDLVVDDTVIIELKAVSAITNEHSAQLINYLTVTGLQLGYVLNFGGDRRFERRLGPSALHIQ